MSEEVLQDLVDHSAAEIPEVTREEVEEAVRKLRNGKAAGGEEIVAELLQYGREAITDWLFELIQDIWDRE